VKYIKKILLTAIFLIPLVAQAFEAFKVESIRLEGLRRIAAGTVFNYLPIKTGDNCDQERASAIIAALFKTGFFQDVRVQRENNILIIQVKERPAIATITITGNEEIETEELNRALKQIGFAEGRVFNRSLLEKVELELQRQYFSIGKYSVRIQSTVSPISRNRVAVQIKISEGLVASIRQITFVGNHVFNDDQLLGEMELKTQKWYNLLQMLTKTDQYSKQKLAGDLENLRSYYLDRGYINFNIDSTQVTISPDKKNVYLTINLTEGDKYTITDIKLIGNLIVTEAELRSLMSIKSGEIFARKEVMNSTQAMLERIGDEGYAFAKINPVPEIDTTKKTVILSFFVDPGKRVYVRRINFIGNTKTRDEVLRRELRQMEGAWISNKDVKRSSTRLERLGYFEEVKVDTVEIPNTTDQVDVNYTIVERASGNLMAGVGYSQLQGFLFNASIEQDNFLGSGNRVGLAFNNSQVNTIYRFSFFNPYTTINGVSRNFDLFYQTTDAEEANLSRYNTDMYGGNLNYGIPLTEFNSLTLGAAFDHTNLKTTEFSAQEIFDFVKKYGDTYDSFRFTGSWAHDTRNRTLLPEKGLLQIFSAEVALPFSDLDYYKVSYTHHWLYPLAKDYILSLRGSVAYGDGYGEDELPFFENYTAGGPRTVRGFRGNTLGPHDSNDLPLGGNLRVFGNAEIILPIPFTEKVRSFRLSTFLDAGNVYGLEEKFDAAELRYSAGISAIWISPLGTLTFSLAKPLNPKEGDKIQMLQFSIGTTF
jgi:outer membrane protein insertion porin family